MTDARLQTIEHLLWEGQDHFRRHAIGRAEACWRQVLDLDPHEARASHLLQSAQRSIAAFMAELRPQLQQLFAERRFAEMVEVLEVAKVRCPTADGVADLLRLVKQRVVHDCYAALGGLDRVPLPVNVAGRLLTQPALTMAALIDGNATVRTLVAQSPLGQFVTLLALDELLRFAAMQLTGPAASADALAPAVALGSGAYTRRTKPGYAFKDLPPGAYLPAERLGTNSFVAQVPTEAEFEAAYNAATEAYLASDYSQAEVLYHHCLQQRPDDKRTRHNLDVLQRRRR